MDVPDNKTGLIFTCANAGLAIGALGFGLLVDIIGRKWAFNLTCLICSVFGMLLVRFCVFAWWSCQSPFLITSDLVFRVGSSSWLLATLP